MHFVTKKKSGQLSAGAAARGRLAALTGPWPLASNKMKGGVIAKGRSYTDAVNKLYSLQSNAATIEQWKAARRENKTVDLKDEMLGHLERLGVDVKKLNVLHVAGTKGFFFFFSSFFLFPSPRCLPYCTLRVRSHALPLGKGSVCAMTEALLRTNGAHTGMFISPHLVEPRERIRIGGRPLSEDQFARFFWRTFDVLSEGASVPPFFRFLNCMGFLVFQEEAVDVAVVEVGVGGRACSTNVVHPVATAVTRLGFDHMVCLRFPSFFLFLFFLCCSDLYVVCSSPFMLL